MASKIASSEIREVLVALGLGSNRGESAAILAGAAEALAARLREAKLSSLYESDPMYVLDQARYLNAVMTGIFSGSPRDLLNYVQGIEARFGRDRSRERRRGERTLDIDILLFGGFLVEEPPTLEIPHPGLSERKFALVPLLELRPEAADPRTGAPFADLLSVLGEQGIYYANLAPYNRFNGFTGDGRHPQFSPQGIRRSPGPAPLSH